MDENKVDFEKMTPAERLKYEVAEEIGLADKVRQYGWRSLTALENKGKIQYFQGLSNLPAAGLEPARCCHQWILSPPRLPFRQAGCLSTLFILPKLETDCNCFFVCFEIKKRSIRRGLRVSLK